MSDLLFEGVQKDFGVTTAVADFDLHVESGECVVLLGPSGCGKTTTLRMVAGFEHPTHGSITIGDAPVAGPGVFVPPDRREVGVVFQSYALWPHMTVAGNIGFGLTVRRRRRGRTGHGRKQVAERVEAILEQVQLGGLGHRYPHELSGGQQQRVALARALITEPRVLLLDEPLSNLDTRLREEMRLEIRRIQREFGITMIYITHDRTEALALSDRIVALRAGRTQQVGPPEVLYQRPRNRFVALALGPANFLPATVEAWHPDPLLRLVTGQVVEAAPTEVPRPVGAAATVCVRPQNIALDPVGDRPDGSTGVVEDAVFLGDEVHYLIDVDGLDEPCRVVDRVPRPMARGTRVSLTVTPGAASVLDEPDTASRPEPVLDAVPSGSPAA